MQDRCIAYEGCWRRVCSSMRAALPRSTDYSPSSCLPSLPSQVENAIRLLLELEPDSDPIWHHVTMQDRRIRGLLEACVQQHESRVAALKKEQHEKREAEARWRQIQQESNAGCSAGAGQCSYLVNNPRPFSSSYSQEDVHLLLLLGQPAADDSSDGLMDEACAVQAQRIPHEQPPTHFLCTRSQEDVDLSLLLGQPAADDSSDGLMDGEAFDEAHTRLIVRLTAILQQHVPRFWRLTRSIFSGKFASFATSKDGTGTVRSGGGVGGGRMGGGL
ncbi:unnamed protein product [Closterium sp. NIES-53]